MVSTSPSVFVCGVTGNQGGALAKLLLELNWNVHAIVRNLNSDKAVSLAAAGVQLTRGDHKEETALRTSITGCSKVFINLVPTFVNFDRERRQAVLICNIAKEFGVEQVIASATVGVSQIRTEGQNILEPGTLLHTSMAVNDEIEKAVKNIGFPSCTFLKPGYFMANFLEPMIDGYTELMSEGTWSTVLKADTRIGMTDHEDIAKVAVAVMQNPERFNGHTIDPADIPVGSVENPYVKGDKCLEHIEEYVNMKELGAITPLTRFKDFLERQKNRVKRF